MHYARRIHHCAGYEDGLMNWYGYHRKMHQVNYLYIVLRISLSMSRTFLYCTDNMSMGIVKCTVKCTVKCINKGNVSLVKCTFK